MKFNIKNIFTKDVKQKNMPSYDWSSIFSNNVASIENDVTFQNSLKFRSESLGKIPIRLVKRKNNQVEIVMNDLSQKLFFRPNCNEDASTFFNNIEHDRLLYGTAYAYIQRDLVGEVKNIIRLNHHMIQVPVIIDSLEFQNEQIYTYTGTQGVKKISSEDLLIFRNSVVNENNPLEGKKSSVILQQHLKSNMASIQSSSNMAQNGVSSVLKVSVDNTINSELAPQIIANAINSAKGANSSGVIFEEEGVKIDKLEVDNVKSQFLDIYKVNQCAILSFFGLSASMLNIEQSSGTYNNSESQMLHYMINTLLFAMEQYINELNYKLLTTAQIKEGYTFEFDTSNILKVDYQTLVETTNSLVLNGAITIDEARAKVGYNSMPNNIGNTAVINGAYVKLCDIGIAYDKNTIKGE